MIEFVRAGYPCIGVQTYEEDRFLKFLRRELESVAPDVEFQVSTWSALSQNSPAEEVMNLSSAPSTPGTWKILVLKDVNRLLEDITLIRAIRDFCANNRRKRKTIILLAPSLSIPEELMTDVVLWDFPLPSESELLDTAKRVVENLTKTEVKGVENSASAKGLTLHEAENTFVLSLVRTKGKEIDRRTINEQKADLVRKSGLLELFEPEKEENLGGFEYLKEYVRRRKKAFSDSSLPAPKGIVLVGPPGTGKSLSAKVTASILNLPLVRFNIPALKSPYVGESQRRMKQALKVVDAVSPCVVWIDEIEKALSGVQSSSRSDAGTTASMFGELLTWMQESKAKKFIVATANDVEELLSISQGALLRRFDELFFVDLPSLSQRVEIFKIMNRKYGTNLSPEKWSKVTSNWSGAEIEKFVINSIYDGEELAYRTIRPLYEKNMTLINKLRQWAYENAVPVNQREEEELLWQEQES